MSFYKLLSATSLVLATALVLCPTNTAAADLRSYHNSLEARYARSHSLGDNYQFEARDGWHAVNISNLQYKYRREDTFDLEDTEDDVEDDPDELQKRDGKKAKASAKSKAKSKSKSKAKVQSKAKSSNKSKSKSNSKAKASSNKSSVTGSLTSSLKKILDSIKAIGKPEPVTITWYVMDDQNAITPS